MFHSLVIKQGYKLINIKFILPRILKLFSFEGTHKRVFYNRTNKNIFKSVNLKEKCTIGVVSV